MAACSSLDHIFDKPLPDNPSLLDSLSSCNNHLNSLKPLNLDHSSNITEFFGELHFNDTVQEIDDDKVTEEQNKDAPDKKASFFPIRKYSSMNSESLSMCTEGLGFESFDDVEESKTKNYYFSDSQSPLHRHEEKSKKSKASKRVFPPPISSIGRTGKPWVYFKSYRQDGRFILQEIRVPTQQSLHASREDGRLKLQLIQSSDDDDEILDCGSVSADEGGDGSANGEESIRNIGG